MSAVARRYAKAIFAIAQEVNQVQELAQQLAAAAQLATTPLVKSAADSPLLSPQRRKALVNNIAAQLSLSTPVTSLLHLLADGHRLTELPSIAEHYQHLEDQALGRVRVRIDSAVPLDAGQRDQLVRAFEHGLGKTVLAREEVDPALLGGVVVEAEGKVYDGSVRTFLQRLAHQIARSTHS